MPPGRHAGQKSQPAHYSFQTADYDLLQVIWVGRGRLFFETAGHEEALGPGRLLLLRRGGAFRLHTEEEPYSGVYFIAAGDDRPEFRGAPAAPVADAPARMLAAMMEADLASPGHGSAELLEGLGLALAWRAVRLVCAGAAGAQQDPVRYWAETARGALEATLTTGRGAAEVLAPLEISYRQLSRLFHRTFGVSPKRYQVLARLREAKRLLTGTSVPVTAIAYELGYPSSQHFATQFRRETGMPPAEWRRRGGKE
jgi:AraC-like DNA-binding protein